MMMNKTIIKMQRGARDILVVSPTATLSERHMQQELRQLNEILLSVESLRTNAIMHEVIDLNRYKIIRKPAEVSKTLLDRNLKPFIFICNKN